MAAIHGKRGTATFSGLTLEVQGWTVNGTADVEDATIMDVTAIGETVHWKTKVIGYKDWTAQVTVVLPAAGVGVAALGTSATLTLDTTDGLDYSGTAICTGISISSGNQTVTATCDFEGNGQLTESAS